MPLAANCPRQDHAAYLADCIVRALLRGEAAGRTGDFTIAAGIGVYAVTAGIATFTPAHPRGLGDLVEKAAKPIARVLRLPCVNQATGALDLQSPCAKRRELLNRAVPFKPAGG